VYQRLYAEVEGLSTDTLERYSPGTGTVALHREHEARYQFASAYVRDRRVADVACGSGMGTSLLLRAGARSVAGVDISGDAIEYASEHFPGPSFAQGDACDIPLPDESVDVVVSFETIEHIKDTDRFLRECSRILAPGGILIGSTPNEPVFTWLNGFNEYHLSNFGSREFKRALEAKFSEVRLFAQSPLNVPASLAFATAVKAVRALHLNKPLLKVFPRPDRHTPPSQAEYALPTGESEIRPYEWSYVRQPLLTVAVAKKPL
jgi:2-polyprenyl-3-methyl-5-hydroxy-6-metoxy-1,4-benzoquinol methylase